MKKTILNKFHIFIILPILFFLWLLVFEFIWSSVLWLSHYKKYIPIVKNEEKLNITNNEIIDLKNLNYDNFVIPWIAVLTKKEAIFLDWNYKKKFSLNFSDFWISINPTGFWFDKLWNIYVISDYKYIYRFIKWKGDDNFSYKLKKWKYYPKDDKRFDPSLAEDGAWSNGYYCVSGKNNKYTKFKKVLDIVSPKIIYENKYYILSQLLVLDVWHKKVFKCNHWFWPNNEWDKKFNYDYDIKNPQYLSKDFYVYNKNWEIQDLKDNRKWKIDNIWRIYDDSVFYSCTDKDSFMYNRYCVWNKKYFELFQEKFNKQVKFVFYNKQFEEIIKNINNDYYKPDKNDFDTLVVYKNEWDLYKVNFDLKEKFDLLYSVDYFLINYVLYFLYFYLIFVYVYLFLYFKNTEAKFITLKYVLITSLIILMIWIILTSIGCIWVYWEWGLWCFIMMLIMWGALIINLIISSVLWVILNKKRWKWVQEKEIEL